MSGKPKDVVKPTTLYTYGVKTDETRKARATYEAVRQVRRSREGQLMVDSAPYAAAIRAAMRAGMTGNEVALAAGVAPESVYRVLRGQSRLQKRVATRLERVLRRLADQRFSAWSEVVDHLDYLKRQPVRVNAKGMATWPTRPLMEAVERRYGPPERRMVNGIDFGPPWPSEADERFVYRSEVLDTPRAERICSALGLYPETIWPTWWGLEGGGVSDQDCGRVEP